MQLERTATSRGHGVWLASRAIAVLGVISLALVTAMPASAATLERIKESGRIKLGYLVDARPLSYRNDAGAAEGYAVALCEHVAEQVKKELALPQLAVEWVPVTLESRLREVQQGNIDLLCAPTSVTLSRRKEVSFSIPVFAGGNRAVLRKDSLAALREALGDTPRTKAVWRGSPAAKVLKDTTFAVVSGTTTETWLAGRRAAFKVDAKIVPVPDYRTGLQQLRDRKADVLFGERSVILAAMDDAARADLVVLDQLFTHESAGMALARGDEDFRLLVDSSLSQFYATGEFGDLYRKWFGEYDVAARAFFQWNTLAQ